MAKNKRIGSENRAGPRTDTEVPELQRDFVAALARWPSGVTIVSVRDDNGIYAITATAFCTVSLEPPLVLVCVGRNATVLPALHVDTSFAISILSQSQNRLASMFADTAPIGRDAFAPDGTPVVRGATASFECAVDAMHAAGDHVIVVARVERVDLGADDAAPLVRLERAWRTLAD